MARIKLSGELAVYHCDSRVVATLLLDELCMEKLVKLLREVADFCGVEVITYCVMPNHFNLLVRVPARAALSDEELVGRMEAFYGERGLLTVAAKDGLQNQGEIPRPIRDAVVRRMGDVSEFMKQFKQRYSRWYNKYHGRFGPLWSERFASFVVEDQPSNVRTLAAFIDLIPVRAGIVQDPKDYRHCGYAAALAGADWIRQGMKSLAARKTEPKRQRNTEE